VQGQIEEVTTMLETQQQHLFISELQLNLFQSADTNLTKLNRIAARELQRLARPSLGNGVYNQSGNLLRVLAIQMLSALRVRGEMHVAGRQQQPDLINVIFGSKCKSCDEKGFNPPDDNEAALLLAPRQDFDEITSLLALAYRTEECVARLCRTRVASLRSFFAGTSRLMLALVHQQRQLRKLNPKRVPKIKVTMQPIDADVCISCAEPLNDTTATTPKV
jgi:hypothetical protein